MGISSPPIFDRRCESYRGAQIAFDAHKCDQHPLNRKTASEGRELKRPCRAAQNLRHIFVQKRQGSSTKSKGILCERIMASPSPALLGRVADKPVGISFWTQ